MFSVFLAVFALFECNAQFITQWVSSNVTLPLNNQTLRLDIDWGDGHKYNQTINFSHVYNRSGVYNISIYGEVRKFSFFPSFQTDIGKSGLVKILQWGNFVVDDSFYGIFQGCDMLEEITALDQPKFVANATMAYMFRNCQKLNSPLSWDVSNVQNMSYAFSGCVMFNQSIAFINTSNVEDMNSMFYYAPAFNFPINFDTRNVVNLRYMFGSAYAFNQPLNFDLSKAKTIEWMFYDTRNFNSLINFTNSGSVTLATGMFSRALQYNKPLYLNLSSCFDWSYMFSGATRFNSSLNFVSTSNAASMTDMFSNASMFNQVVNFDTQSVSWAERMFDGATSFNQPINFNTWRMTSADSMFRNCRALNQPVTLDVSSLTSTFEMFSGCSELNQPVTLINADNLNNMNRTFANAVKFNQPINWNTSSVISMAYLFYNTSFNQTLTLDLSRVSFVNGMFANTSYKFDLASRNVSSVHAGGCSDFCVDCGLPDFPSCNSCSNGSVVSSKGWKMCSCPSGDVCASPSTPPTPPTTEPTPTSASPTFGPTTTGPTTTGPTTTGPTTTGPTTTGPTTAPTSAPSIASTSGPSIAPASAPSTARPSPTPTSATLAQPCSTCDITVKRGSGNISQTVFVGSTSVVAVTVPSSIFRVTNTSNNTSNITVRIAILPFSSGPPTTQAPGGSVIVSINIMEQEKERLGFVPLDDPISFVIPLTNSAKATLSTPSPCTAVHVQCVWRDGNLWVDSGCQATIVGNGTQCVCNHLTDFAVLLNQRNTCKAEQQSVAVYYPFVVFYALIMLYCGVCIALLVKATTSRANHTPLIIHHVLVGVVALLRMISCLQFLNAISESLGLKAFLSALPYPLEYLLFTRLAFSWMGLVHFAMIAGDVQWKKLRPLFVVTNVLGTLLAVAVFVVFTVQASKLTTIIGTIVLSVIYLCLGVLFQVYSVLLQRQLQGAIKVKKMSNASKSSTSGWGLQDRIKWTGRSTTFCFIVQAACNVGSILSPSEHLEVWTAGFLTANVLALVSLLVIFYAGVTKAVASFNFLFLVASEMPGASPDRSGSSRPSSVHGSTKSARSSFAVEAISRPDRPSTTLEIHPKSLEVEMSHPIV